MVRNEVVCLVALVAVLACDLASGGQLGGGGGGGGYPRGGPGGFNPGQRPSSTYNSPSGGGGGGYNGGGGGYNGGGGGGGGGGKPEPYNFQYAVKDAASGNDYRQQESSDGYVTRGEYSVLLPDGRTQVVKYTADDANGFVADVQYQGVANNQGGGGGGYGGGGHSGGGGGGGGGGQFGGSNSYLPPNYRK